MNYRDTMNEMLDMTYDPTKFTAPYHETKWVVLSSMFFMFPAIYGYYYELYRIFYVLLFTSLISANYWKRANYSWERMLDRCFAKISSGLFTIHGIANMNEFKHIVTGYPCLFLSFYYYYKSNSLCGISNKWVRYHMTFHFLLMCGQFMIINNILHNKEMNKETCLLLC